MNTTFDASAIQAWRKRAKAGQEALGLPKVTINDLILFAVSRVLPDHQELNAHFLGDKIRQFSDVNIGVAVDTPRGLLVPVLPQAHKLSLEIATTFKPLAVSAIEGTIAPEALSGGTFTVTNLGAMGIESFTPVLNVPEVAILGVGAPVLSPGTRRRWQHYPRRPRWPLPHHRPPSRGRRTCCSLLASLGESPRTHRPFTG